MFARFSENWKRRRELKRKERVAGKIAFFNSSQEVLLKLSQAKHVSVRVFKPRDTGGSARYRPDVQLVLSETLIKIEFHAFQSQCFHRGYNVGYFPTQYGMFRRLETGSFRNAQHGAIEIEYNREII